MALPPAAATARLAGAPVTACACCGAEAAVTVHSCGGGILRYHCTKCEATEVDPPIRDWRRPDA